MTTKIDPKGGITRYLQLYAALSQELADGVIDPGAMIPSEPSLVRKYRVSRTTVRRALARLETEGKIVRRRGSGTFATERSHGPLRPGERISHLQSHTEIAPTDAVFRSQRLDAHAVGIPAAVEKSMQGFGTAALMIRTLRLLRGQPFAIATSYFVDSRSGSPPAESSSSKERSRRGKSRSQSQSGNKPGDPDLVEAAAQKLATQIASGEQIVAAIAADAFSAGQLGIPVGAPLLQVRRFNYDSNGRPLEYQDVCYRADLFELRMLTAPEAQGVLAAPECETG